MAKTYTSVPTVSTLATYPSATYNTYTAQNINNLIVPPAARARLTSAKSLATAAAISWDTTATIGWDTDSMWSVSSPTRLTANTPGLYVVTVNVLIQVTVAASTVQAVQVRCNGTSYGEWSSYQTVPINGFVETTVTALINATTAGDYFDASYAFTGGSHSALSDNRNSFSAVWVGRTS